VVPVVFPDGVAAVGECVAQLLDAGQRALHPRLQVLKKEIKGEIRTTIKKKNSVVDPEPAFFLFSFGN
jgi:hypothetical protein